jgi:hypothetical protein
MNYVKLLISWIMSLRQGLNLINQGLEIYSEATMITDGTTLLSLLKKW